MLAVSAHQLADEHPVRAWSMVMFMVQSNLRRYIRDSKDIGKAQLNKRSCCRMNCPSFKGYSVQRCMFNQVHFQNYGGRQRRRGLEAWNGFHCDRHRLCSFLRGRLRRLLYRFAFLPLSQKSLCLCLCLRCLLYMLAFLTNFTIMLLKRGSSIGNWADACVCVCDLVFLKRCTHTYTPPTQNS